MPNTILIPRVGRVYKNGWPNIQHYLVTAGQDPTLGSLVVLAAAGTVSVCGDDPATILGLSLGYETKKAGYGMANNPSQVQHRDARLGVAIADNDTVYAFPGHDGTNYNTTPVAANVGVSYGIKLNSGIFYINTNDTTGPTLRVVDIDIPTKTFFAIVVAGARQI